MGRWRLVRNWGNYGAYGWAFGVWRHRWPEESVVLAFGPWRVMWERRAGGEEASGG